MSEQTYRIVRFFFEGPPRQVIATGLTLEQAQAWCNNPQTSSRTATTLEAKTRTARFGDWFDGYERE